MREQFTEVCTHKLQMHAAADSSGLALGNLEEAGEENNHTEMFGVTGNVGEKKGLEETLKELLQNGQLQMTDVNSLRAERK